MWKVGCPIFWVIQISGRSSLCIASNWPCMNSQLSPKDDTSNCANENQSSREPRNRSSPFYERVFILSVLRIGALLIAFIGASTGFMWFTCSRGLRQVVGLLIVIISVMVGMLVTAISPAHLSTTYRRSENIGVETVVVPELKFRNVQRHIFGADFVETTDDATLEDAPKTLNRVCMHRADHVLPRGV